MKKKKSYNYAINKCELVKISNLHNYDQRNYFSNFPFSETFYANFDSIIVIFERNSVDRYDQPLF